jgi:hybrid cluster-associated redox disulfide protein
MARARLDDPDLPLADLMTTWPQTIPVFVRHRMLCVGCLVSPFHTVTDACAEYHLDEDAFLMELRQAAERD